MPVKKKKAVKKRTAKKKAVKKKAVKKKAVKKLTRKKAAVRKPAKKTARKKAPKTGAKRTAAPTAKKAAAGPRPGIPAVRTGTSPSEEAVGIVTHYYSHLSVAIVQVNKGEIRTGDTIRIKGHTTDMTQQVESMEYEHQHIDAAAAGMSVGIRVKDHAREHDIVYKV